MLNTLDHCRIEALIRGKQYMICNGGPLQANLKPEPLNAQVARAIVYARVANDLAGEQYWIVPHGRGLMDANTEHLLAAEVRKMLRSGDLDNVQSRVGQVFETENPA